MRYSITKSDAFPLVQVTLNSNEEIKLESGAMVYHTHGIELHGEKSGKTILSSISQAAFGNENFFRTKARSSMEKQEIALAAKGIGRVVNLKIGTTQYLLNDGVFLACDTSVDLKMVMQKNKVGAFFGGNGGLFVMQTSGTGDMIINAFGDIQEIRLDGTKSIIIDNKHVICWEDTLNYNLTTGGGTFGFKTGEGIVNNFSGVGKIYVQTRHVESLAEMLVPFMPNQKNSRGFTIE